MDLLRLLHRLLHPRLSRCQLGRAALPKTVYASGKNQGGPRSGHHQRLGLELHLWDCQPDAQTVMRGLRDGTDSLYATPMLNASHWVCSTCGEPSNAQQAHVPWARTARDELLRNLRPPAEEESTAASSAAPAPSSTLSAKASSIVGRRHRTYFQCDTDGTSSLGASTSGTATPTAERTGLPTKAAQKLPRPISS